MGEDTRTDRQGLLLLISPPGYGKTTLMEYTASVLGLTFMKINGPALGHDVVSLDPDQAQGATAKQELIKCNLAQKWGITCCCTWMTSSTVTQNSCRSLASVTAAAESKACGVGAENL